MKKIFFWLFGLSVLLALILCFQNMAMRTLVGILFSVESRSLFGVLGLMYLLGLAGGVFLGFAFMHRDRPGSGGNF